MDSAKRILIIEDDPDVQTVTSFVLRSAGYFVVTVKDRDAAASMVLQFKPDLIIMDFRMEGMSLGDFLTYARGQSVATHFLLLSADAMEVARAHNIAYWLPKPFNIDELLSLVARCFRGGSSSFMNAVQGDPNQAVPGVGMREESKRVE